jgi:hypothetical protein
VKSDRRIQHEDHDEQDEQESDRKLKLFAFNFDEIAGRDGFGLLRSFDASCE